MTPSSAFVTQAPGAVDVADLRHELSAPLAAVTALVGALATESSDRTLSVERRREIAQLAYWQARHMAAVLTGTAAGTRALIEVVVAAGVAAGVPQPRLRTEVTAEAAAASVEADPVQQVLTNLLVNAVRHGAPDAEIRLAVRLERAGGRDLLVIAVHNRLAAPFRTRVGGRGLRVVSGIVDRAHGSFTVRPVDGAVVAEATLPLAGGEAARRYGV